jgi:hypothetical protein
VDPVPDPLLIFYVNIQRKEYSEICVVAQISLHVILYARLCQDTEFQKLDSRHDYQKKNMLGFGEADAPFILTLLISMKQPRYC